MKTSALLRLVVFGAFVLLSFGRMARAGTTFIATDTTINYPITGDVVVGYANGTDLSAAQNPTNPTVTIVQGGSISGGLSVYNKSVVTVTGDASVTIGSNLTNPTTGLAANNNSIVNISGGSIPLLYSYGSAMVNVNTGSGISTLTAGDTSTVNVKGGTVTVRLDANVNSHVNVASGSNISLLACHDTSNTTITGGTVTNIGLSQYITLAISGGSIGTIGAKTGTYTLITGGTIGTLNMDSWSTVDMNGGVINAISHSSYSGTSTFNFNAGACTTDVNVYGGGNGGISHSNYNGGGIGGNLFVHNNSIVNYKGGSVAKSMFTYDTSVNTITGGSIVGNLTADVSSTVNFNGGAIGGNLYALKTSSFNIYGTNLTGALISSNVNLGSGIFASQFQISGTLSDGTVIVNKNLFIQNGSGVKFSLKSFDINNGSFETPYVYSYAYNLTGGVWTFSGNAGIEHNGSAFGAANATDGVQAAFLQGSPGQGAGILGSISQAINFSGGTYTITYAAAQRKGQVQPVQFSVDGGAVGATVAPTANAFADATTAPFTVSAGQHTIQFAATFNGYDSTTFIDNVRLNRVATTVATVTGHIALEGVPNLSAANTAVAPLGTFDIQFRTLGTKTIVKEFPAITITPTGATANGSYSVSGVPAGIYDVWIKGVKNLAALAPNVTLAGSAGTVPDVMLGAGDSDNNNTVNVLDFGNLVNAYGSNATVAGSGYDASADFNYDGAVDVLDFGILVNSYGANGAP